MKETNTRVGKDRFTPCFFGFALIAVGLAICFVGAQRFNLILEHGIRSAPAIILLVFAGVGVGFIVNALLRK
jgi:hypothetical protein